jgi:hypothetical protein
MGIAIAEELLDEPFTKTNRFCGFDGGSLPIFAKCEGTVFRGIKLDFESDFNMF